MQALHDEASALRTRNAALETSLDEHMVRQAMAGMRSNANIRDSTTADLSRKLKARLRHLRAEVETLRQQVRACVRECVRACRAT